jgi:hypothetical protein
MDDKTIELDRVSSLGDVELIAGLRRLVRADQALTARLLLHLGEVDSRGLYREHAFDSMFAYAVEELHMSEAEAYLRIQAARAARQFPLVLQMLAKGELHLTAIKLLAPHLTAENQGAVLERAKFKGKRDIELLVAELAPKPDAPTVMRKLPTPIATRAISQPTLEGLNRPTAEPIPPATDRALQQPTAALTAASAREPSKPESLEQKSSPTSISRATPLSPGRYLIKFTASEEMHNTLEHLRNLLRHQVPNGDFAIILERAAKLLLEKTMKERFAKTTRKPTCSFKSSARLEEARANAVVRPQSALNTNIRPSQAEANASETVQTVSAPNGLVVDESSRSVRTHPRTSCSRDRSVLPNSGSRVTAPLAMDARSRLNDARPASDATDQYATDPAAADASAQVKDVHATSNATDQPATDSPATDASGQPTQASSRPRVVDAFATRANRQPNQSHSRYVPRAVVREVHERDGEQCTFVRADGKRCKAKSFLELHHHDTPFAMGGPATAANLRTMCRAHNAFFGERDFGRAFMRSKLNQARQRTGSPPNQQVPDR